MNAAPPPAASPREAAKRALRGNRGRPAVLLLDGIEVHCTAIVQEGVTYALAGFALHVGATVRWL